MSFTRLAAAFLLSIVAPSLGAAESSSPPRISPSDETSIRELETMSWVAWKGHDASFFQRFLSDDHVEVHSYGIVDKAAVVDGVRSPACVVESYSIGAFSLTAVSEDTVLVTYRAEQKTQCAGVAVPSPVWTTSLYVRRAGRWFNILLQQTPVARG
jgi:hypothetical protein